MLPCLDLGGVEEAELYHDISKFGFFSVLYAVSGRKYQSSYRLPMLGQILPLLPRDRDTWLSQAEFVKPNRRIVNLARISLLFVDIDCYKFNFAPKKAYAAVKWACDAAGLPHPSIAIRSGRGLQIKWLLTTPLPRHALPRWNAVQARLVDLFATWGADPAAKDASRVLRLVGTVNSKSGEFVQVIDQQLDKDGQLLRHDFEWLCELVLPGLRAIYDKKLDNHPFTVTQQAEIAAAREQRQVDFEARKATKQLRLITGADITGLHKFSARQLAWHRLEDLRKLNEIRGGVTPGMSMNSLFMQLNFLLLSGAANTSTIFHEAAELSRQMELGEFHRRDELRTLYAKAKDHEAGKMVTFNGKIYPPLYTPKNASLINLFKITDDEQRQLRTIISTDMARERDAGRKRETRHASGENKMVREAYLSANADKRVQARLLKAQGKSIREIAQALTVSVGSIHGWLNDRSASVRITGDMGVQSPSVLLGGERQSLEVF